MINKIKLEKYLGLLRINNILKLIINLYNKVHNNH